MSEDLATELLVKVSVSLTKAEERIAELEGREKQLTQAVEGMLMEWDKFTRYGSPMAKAANERVTFARQALATKPQEAEAEICDVCEGVVEKGQHCDDQLCPFNLRQRDKP